LPAPAITKKSAFIVYVSSGVTLLLALDAVAVPLAFTAATVKVYAIPAAYVPVTVNGLVVPVVVKAIDGEETTVYEVILDPPFAAAVNARETSVGLTTVAVPIVDVAGIVVAVIELVGALENGETPDAFVAIAVKV
jgi:hypothetical protein